MELFFCVIALALAAVVLTVLIRQWVLYVVNPLETDKLTIVVVPDSVENCEHAICVAAEHMKWTEPHRNSRLICLNLKDDQEINAICSCLSQRYPFLTVSNCVDLGYNVVKGKFD